jgi:flagellar biosynthesis protein FlhG
MTAHASPAAHPAAAPSGRNLIAIASGKGGVGKTWLSITLAQAIARVGGKTLLFDGDLGLANVDIQLGLMPDSDLGTAISGRARLADTVTSFPDGGFDIIAGKSGSGSLASLEKSRLFGLRSDLLTLARDYYRVVIDLGAGIDAAVRSLAAASGRILVVTNDEPTALTDAYAFIKVMAGHNHGKQLAVVVNMADSPKEGKATYDRLLKACDSFLGLKPPLAGVIRADSHVRDSIRHQTAILKRYPTCDASADVVALAKKLTSGP